MILGLDIGGTHTDAVLIDGRIVLAQSKTPTSDDLLSTLQKAITSITDKSSRKKIDRMVFSTTLTTNAVIQNTLHPTGMIITAGPGIDPELFAVGPSYHIVRGCMDHQGFETDPIDADEIIAVIDAISSAGIDTVGISGKFSVRNPDHEKNIAMLANNNFSHVSLGHKISGKLDFPRRIATTYLNAALHNAQKSFVTSLNAILRENNFNSPAYVLKPDGGVWLLGQSLESPVMTAQSGPAASVIGALALDKCKGITLIMDIGGTTTDITLVKDGVPLIAPYGLEIGDYKTLIHSLLTNSVAIGGDSQIQLADDKSITIGPLRLGNPIAFGGSALTPTDAIIAIGLLDAGNRKKSVDAIKNMGDAIGRDYEDAAHHILVTTGKLIADAAKKFISNINAKPVYTIFQALEEEKLIPSSAVIIGGPAPFLATHIENHLGIPCRVTPYYNVANAIGAAVSRVTFEINLQADTERGTVVIPEIDFEANITRDFSINDAVFLAKEKLLEEFMKKGGTEQPHITITERSVFPMIRGYSKVGQNIRLTAGITPGIIWNTKETF